MPHARLEMAPDHERLVRASCRRSPSTAAAAQRAGGHTNLGDGSRRCPDAPTGARSARCSGCGHHLELDLPGRPSTVRHLGGAVVLVNNSGDEERGHDRAPASRASLESAAPRRRRLRCEPRARRSTAPAFRTRGARNPEALRPSARDARLALAALEPDRPRAQAAVSRSVAMAPTRYGGPVGSEQLDLLVRAGSSLARSLGRLRGRGILSPLVVGHLPDYQRAALDLLTDQRELVQALLLGSLSLGDFNDLLSRRGVTNSRGEVRCVGEENPTGGDLYPSNHRSSSHNRRERLRAKLPVRCLAMPKCSPSGA